MTTEAERKFLVTADDWREHGVPTHISQGYIANDARVEVRVRRKGTTAYLTIKSKSPGRVRSEYEYEIPQAHADEILRILCLPFLIEKARTEVIYEGRTWEVDEFEGGNSGLVLAEVELSDPNENLNIPPWVGDEVTDDPRFRNAYLAEHPFNTWAK